MIVRRSVVAGSVAALAGCAAVRRPSTLAQVNFADVQPPSSDDAQLGAGRDSAMRVTVPVRLAGQGPFAFIVDTGANRSVVSAELAASLGLASAGVTNVHGVAGVAAVPTFHIDRLDVQAVTSRGLQLPALPRELLGADGLLGVDVLRERRVVLDFVRQSVSISAARQGGPERSSFDMRRDSTSRAEVDLGKPIKVPARYRFGQLIIVAGDVARRPVIAFVDTGSQSTVGNPVLRRLAVAGDPAAPRPLRFNVPVLSATGQTSEGELAMLPVLKIGGLTITNLSTVFADLHIFEIWDLTKRASLVLGMDVIRKFSAIELNYASREVVFYLHRDL